MSLCELTTDLILDCKNSMGGISDIYIAKRSLVTDITIDPSGDIVTDFTFASGGFFHYQLRDESGTFNQESQGEEANGTHFYERTLTVPTDKMTSVTRNEMMALAKIYSIAVVRDNNGRYWLLGDGRGLRDNYGSTAGTGQAKADRNGFELTLVDHEKMLAYEVAEAAVTNNLAP
jgi:hypothetical protein